MSVPNLAGPVLMTVCAALAAARADAADPPRPVVTADVVLKGGTLVDGTGSPARPADVALKGDRVVAVGTFSADPKAKVVDVHGLVVAPGFIDLHTHSDDGIVKPRTRSNANYQAQGVTTIVTGNCGGGTLDVATYFRTIGRLGSGANVVHLVPLGDVRRSVIGNDDRRPTPRELEAMSGLVERDMKAGAWGVSTGLIYVPGRYATTDEIAELAKVAAHHGGIYASHIRNEGGRLLDAIDEALAVGSKAGIAVHISHLKASGKANWGLVGPACERIAAARKAGKTVSADQYPYVASSTRLAAMVVPDWAVRGDAAEFRRIADDSQLGPRLRREIQRELDGREGGATVRIARYAPKPSRVGKSLTEIAQSEKTTPLEVVLDIHRHGGAQAISFGMSEDDVRAVMAHDFVATASDGSTHVAGGGDQPHPRAYGTFPRKIRYALDDHVISLEQAVRSCSGLPAQVLRLPDRGVVRVGAFADVLVFDPATFRDAGTFDRPTVLAPGVRHLFINGVAVIQNSQPTGALPGRALRLDRDGPPDVILSFGRVWTGDPNRPWAEAVASRSGAVVAVGTRAEVEALRGPLTRVVSRPEAFAMPGLIDAHVHLSELGVAQEELDLRGASLDEVARRVKERAGATPAGTWITGRSWDQSLWPGGAFPTAAVLDAATADHPVWLRRVDGHAGWANTEALRRAGVTKESKAPPDGQILRDARGEPTGVFVDGAMGLVGRAVPSPTKADVVRQLLKAQRTVLESGLTGVHDAGLSRLEIEALRELDIDRRLKLRVHGMALPPEGHEEDAVKAPPPAPPRPDARFRLRAIKLFIDGAMGSRGALLFAPYSDDPSNSGLTLIDPARLEAVTTAALRNGWQVCTHAIGDKGNALVLDAYAKALAAVPGARDARLRVEHAQVVRREDVARFKSLGLIASMQPSHASDDLRWADLRLGPGRVDGAYAWRWFLDAGVPLAFGSDFPVEIVSPFYGLYAAVTRQDDRGQPPGGWHPGQRLSLEQALSAFTAGSAYAGFAESQLGVLREGMRADLTVVDRDLFRVEPAELLKTKVVLTVIDGEVVAEPH